MLLVTILALVAAIATALPVVGIEPPESSARDGLLLLRSGRIIQGKIQGDAIAYTVEQPNGRMVVPLQQVLAQCTDLPDAFRRLRENLPDNTAASHVLLARWCMSHKLLKEARDELRAALEIEPERDETRRLLARVNDLLNPDAAPPPPEPPRKKYDLTGMSSQPAEALGGLSRDAALQFTRRVQSILVNNCGNSACHGPTAPQEFRLAIIRTPGGGSRRQVEQNLTAVLQYVDRESPRNSRLLTALGSQAHGELGLKIFQGSRGAEQASEVRDWIQTLADQAAAKQAAAEGPAGKKPPAPPVSRPEKRPAPRSPAAQIESPAVAKKQPLPEAEAVPAAAKSESSRELPGDSPVVDEADAFDPAVFNRERRSRRPGA
jgi:hypothetical protein